MSNKSGSAVRSARRYIDYVTEHPGCTRREVCAEFHWGGRYYTRVKRRAAQLLYEQQMRVITPTREEGYALHVTQDNEMVRPGDHYQHGQIVVLMRDRMARLEVNLRNEVDPAEIARISASLERCKMAVSLLESVG